MASLPTTPNADQHEHRQEFEFEEEEEKEQVERHKDTEDGSLQDQQEGEILLGAQVNTPGDQNSNRGQERVEQDQRHRKAINSQRIADIEADVASADPGKSVSELEASLATIEADIEDERDDEGR